MKVKQRFNSLLLTLLLLIQLTTAVCVAETQTKMEFGLDDCLKLAYENSEKLRTATLKVEKARYPSIR